MQKLLVEDGEEGPESSEEDSLVDHDRLNRLKRIQKMAQQQQTIAMVRGWQVLGGGRSNDGPSSNRQQSERASSRVGYSASSQVSMKQILNQYRS